VESVLRLEGSLWWERFVKEDSRGMITTYRKSDLLFVKRMVEEQRSRGYMRSERCEGVDERDEEIVVVRTS